MLRGRRVLIAIETSTQVLRALLDGMRGVEFFQKTFEPVRDAFIAGDINFRAIASRENRGFGRAAALAHVAQRARQVRRRNRQTLAHFDRRGLVT